jgi:uncharacterized delta-60 repeat protein
VPRCLLFTLFALLALPAGAVARPGQPDPRFGDGGDAVLGRAGANFKGAAVALQGDGRAVVAGSDGRRFLVARFRGSGDPDPTFGRGRGHAFVHFPGATRAAARAVALFRDGRVLVAGTVRVDGTDRLGVARLQPGGNLDPNFGSGGVAVVGPPAAQLEAMALQTEGELVLAGSVPNPKKSRRAVLVMRLLADGSPDPDFGSDGAVDSSAVDLAGSARDVLVLPDGKIALAASVEHARAARATFLAVRLTAAGAFDPSFDDDGVARVATTPWRLRDGGAAAIALERGGRLMLAGTARGLRGRADATVVRLTPDGRPDRRFGRAGVRRFVDPRGRSLQIAAMRRDARGRLVLGGSATGLGAAVLRLGRDGRRDRSFGRRGLSGGRLRRTRIAALALRRDGAVVLAGTARVDGRDNLAVARLLGR